ncbi:MAG: hypothetical protein OEM27_05400 [Nitrospinota bacterium]|nr:hypothetical protein [Nitrospinota bacterium]
MNLVKVAFLSTFVWFWATEAGAHEVGTPFSGAFPEPILLHHAHIEDEQRINLSRFENFRTGRGEESALSGEMELAFTWLDNFRLGSEVFIPFSNTGVSNDKYGIGDLELQPIKYAFLNLPETVLTGALSLRLPTGDESRGLGGEQTALGGKLFLDQAFSNWYVGFNAEYEASVSGPTSSEMEFAGAITYSFIAETGNGVAPAMPHQTLVPTVMLELVSESVLTGDEKGDDIITLAPGLQLWHPESNWKVRLGVGFPLTSDRENDFAVYFQFGNHFDWGLDF